MKNSTFQNKQRKPLHRTGFKQKATKPMKRTKTSKKGQNTPKKRRKKTPLAKAKAELWELCKQITRLRHGYNCYTCGTHSDAPHTGHFISSSICSAELRYDLKNLRPQCFSCNIHKSGNWLAYEKNLIRDHGVKYVNELKRRNEKTKGQQFDILWYQEQIKRHTKELNKLV